MTFALGSECALKSNPKMSEFEEKRLKLKLRLIELNLIENAESRSEVQAHAEFALRRLKLSFDFMDYT